MRIIFMGTPEFAVFSLQKLIESNFNVVGVVTAPDQAAGRGKKIRQSAIKEYAFKQGLKILQPIKLKDPEFIAELRELKADLQIVVAFRMLPEIVWNMPPKGTFNLHASLLPQYRGAAPINHAIINGETQTGVTSFFLDKKIDTGKIILQEKCSITPEDNAGSLHDKLMLLGADLVIKTVRVIESNQVSTKSQNEWIETDLNAAPKIFKQDCQIDWNKSSESIHNKIRGLSPYPAAYSYLKHDTIDKPYYLKIFETEKLEIDYPNSIPGQIFTDSKSYIHVVALDGVLSLIEIQLEGKKRMSVKDFLRGFDISKPCRFTSPI